jgi:signal transduction histidine kinase
MVPSRRTVIKDVLLWALLSFPVVLEMIWHEPGVDSPRWVQACGLLVLGGAVAAGRGYPVVSLLLTSGLIAPFAVGWLHGLFGVGLMALSYLAGRRMARARPGLWVFTATFAVWSVIVHLSARETLAWFSMILWLVLGGVLPWLAGRYWRQYQELRYSGWERAEQLERVQHMLAEQTRLRERARIAQDMHDSLGHDLALIALRAGALQVAPDLAEHHKDAARELRASAAAATDRLKEIIGVLRDGGEPAPTQPVGETIVDLIERAEASGMRINLRQDGTDGDGREPLPPMVDRAAYRVVQESLTNAAKHAPGAEVTVRLASLADGIQVAVVNEPALAATSPAGDSGGHGLTGLRERVRLAGGTLRTGATEQGGFEVIARLPQAAPAAAPPQDRPAAHPARSESAHQLARARQRVRRGLLTAIGTSVGLIGSLGTGFYVYVTFNSVLEPDRFHRLAVGQDRVRVEAVLPKEELLGGPPGAEPPIPRGAACRYYRPDANLLALGTVYRLCFANGRLVAKDAITAAARTIPSPASVTESP